MNTTNKTKTIEEVFAVRADRESRRRAGQGTRESERV